MTGFYSQQRQRVKAGSVKNEQTHIWVGRSCLARSAPSRLTHAAVLKTQTLCQRAAACGFCLYFCSHSSHCNIQKITSSTHLLSFYIVKVSNRSRFHAMFKFFLLFLGYIVKKQKSAEPPKPWWHNRLQTMNPAVRLYNDIIRQLIHLNYLAALCQSFSMWLWPRTSSSAI